MYLSIGKKHDYRNALKMVKVPVLAVHGKKDLQSKGASQYIQMLSHICRSF